MVIERVSLLVEKVEWVDWIVVDVLDCSCRVVVLLDKVCNIGIMGVGLGTFVVSGFGSW